MSGRFLMVLAAAASCAACTHPLAVQRAYGGDVLIGRYVTPEAYAAFLRGALAEAAHRTDEAVHAYSEAARRDPGSPEPWTRIAHVQCASGQRGAAKAGIAVEKALALDPEYARAWEVKAECAGVVGDVAAERAAAARAAQLDPQGDGASILLGRSDGGEGSTATREGLVALTVTAHDPVAAWDALSTWAEAHGDVALWTRSLIELARIAPERREAIARTAEELAGAGAVAEARTTAGAAVDADERPLPARLALAARLALDDAIARGDSSALRRRATRARLPLDEAAARALLAGRWDLARTIASTVAAADPGARGPRLVLAVADGGDLLEAATPRPGDAPASAASFVALGTALLRGMAPAAAGAALAALPHEPLTPGDDRVLRPAVALVSRGVLGAGALPPDGAVELAAIAGGPPSAPLEALDLRHRYLALALTQPDAPATRDLAAHLRTAADDPVVAAAASLVQLASGAPIPADAPRALLARNPADPLLATVALRLAEKIGDADVARRARETLAAVSARRRSVD